jgi:phage shock protein C
VPVSVSVSVPVRSSDQALKESDLMAMMRSRRNRVIGGVCGGIAESLGWDPTLVRVLYVLVSILSAAFPGILVYLVLWAVMPQSPA